MNSNSQLIDAAGIVYLTSENCKFRRNGDFLAVTLNSADTKEYTRVKLHRMFPFNCPDNYISVLNNDSEEIGIITDFSNFDTDTVELIKNELDRKYYVCKLNSIISVKERFGFSYWKAMSEHGEISFTIKDVHSSIRVNGIGNILISDIDSNRYELPEMDKLDSKSKKLIELYL